MSVKTKKCKSKRTVGILLSMVCIGNFSGVTKVDAAAPFSIAKVSERLGSDEWQLLRAAENGDIGEVQRLLAVPGININAIDCDGRTALHYAVENENIGIFEALIVAEGIDVNIVDLRAHQTALDIAILNRNIEIIRTLHAARAMTAVEVDIAHRNSWTALHIAVDAGDVDRVQLLVQGGTENLTVGQLRAVWDIARRRNDKRIIAILQDEVEEMPAIPVAQVRRAQVKAVERSRQFIQATKEENWTRVRELIAAKVDVNASDEKGRTALHYTVIKGNACIVQELIAAGANVMAKDQGGMTALRFAHAYGRLDIARELTEEESKANAASLAVSFAPDSPNSGYEWNLIQYARDGNENRVLELIAHVRGKRISGFNFNAADRNGRTALHCATQGGHLRVVRVLTRFADVNATDSNGMVPLHLASRNGDEAMVRLLLGVDGIKVNEGDNDGMMPLHFAARNGNVKIVKLLLRAGADINAAGAEDRTALHWAAIAGNFEVVRVLIMTMPPRVNVNAVDANGDTALILAAKSGYWKSISLLLFPITIELREDGTQRRISENGIQRRMIGGEVLRTIKGEVADVNVLDRNGMTALHWAVDSGSVEAVQLLLRFPGINVNAENRGKITPLHWASRNGNAAIVRLLLKAPGVNVNAVNGDLRTPIHFAAMGGHIDIVRMLVVAGANPNAKDMSGKGLRELWKDGCMSCVSIMEIVLSYEEAQRVLINYLGQ